MTFDEWWDKQLTNLFSEHVPENMKEICRSCWYHGRAEGFIAAVEEDKE